MLEFFNVHHIGPEEDAGKINGEVTGASPCRKSEGLEEIS